MPEAKVFISHSAEDSDIALKVKYRLEKLGVEAWCYESDILFGDRIPSEIERGIRECDCLLVVLSDSAQESEWVARELGLALELHAERDEELPIIIGVQCGRPWTYRVFEPRAFNGGWPIVHTHDFSAARYFSFNTKTGNDDMEQLVDQVRPRSDFIGSIDGSEGELLHSSFRCYETLFPDPGERDEPSDIETWLEEARRAALTGSPWREIYGVLHMGSLVIGMAYLTAHLGRHWCFGNYFGVRAAWRQNHRAKKFLDDVEARLRAIDPKTKGILFEVEPVDFDCLSRAAARERIAGHPDERDVLLNLRRVRRVALYQMEDVSALSFLSTDNRPLPYWQPAMSDSLDAADEREMILMVRLWGHIDPGSVDVEEILDFIYDDLYRDAYGGAGGVEIPGFRHHVAMVKLRVKEGTKVGWQLGKVPIPKPVRRLLSHAHDEGLSGHLAL
jgi:hypothetical protein